MKFINHFFSNFSKALKKIDLKKLEQSAILIANMYAERIPIDRIESYIESTRRWVNNLVLDLDTLNYSRLLEDKWIKHHEKQLNQFE